MERFTKSSRKKDNFQIGHHPAAREIFGTVVPRNNRLLTNQLRADSPGSERTSNGYRDSNSFSSIWRLAPTEKLIYSFLPYDGVEIGAPHSKSPGLLPRDWWN